MQIRTLNFSDPTAASSINEWVKQNTNSKINDIVETVPENSILFLLNAIYFKGKWTEPFLKKRTQELPFALLNGTRKKHPTMTSNRSEYPYYENEQFQAVSLPYGKGQVSMYVFLPKKGVSLETFYRQLNSKSWQQWMNQFKSKEGFIKLPRFKIEYESTLNFALKRLGMGVAFDKNLADFSNMVVVNSNTSENKVKIDQIKHKTFVEVNEEGTEAAAITSGIVALSLNLNTFEMIVDRPFFCAIQDNQTGTILFMGSIVEPH